MPVERDTLYHEVIREEDRWQSRQGAAVGRPPLTACPAVGAVEARREQQEKPLNFALSPTACFPQLFFSDLVGNIASLIREG